MLDRLKVPFDLVGFAIEHSLQLLVLKLDVLIVLIKRILITHNFLQFMLVLLFQFAYLTFMLRFHIANMFAR